MNEFFYIHSLFYNQHPSLVKTWVLDLSFAKIILPAYSAQHKSIL